MGTISVPTAYPLTVIEPITYLMLIKTLDENELRKEAIAAFDLEAVAPP